MKILIFGGSGQIGHILARYFKSSENELVNISRNANSSFDRNVKWNAQDLGDWVSEVEGANIVINLAGRSVNCRYNKMNRNLILQSRVRTTQLIGEAITQAHTPPQIWFQASTATIYSHRFDAANDDISGTLGGNEPNLPDTWQFSLDVANNWEESCSKFKTPDTRKILMRAAMVMSPDKHGVFDTLLQLTKLGLGGRAGNGNQFVSWIHHLDFCRAMEFCIENHEISGPVNFASPGPIPNKEFMSLLRKASGMPIGLPAFQPFLEAGAFFMKTETELVLKSRRVTPGILQQKGFQFLYPEWGPTAQNLVAKSISNSH